VADRSGNPQFDEPPQAARGRNGADEEDASAQDFATPGAGAVEAAAISAESEAVLGVPPTLLEVKTVIEQRLLQQATQAVTAREVDTLGDEGGILGVAIGVSDPSSPASNATEPGIPALTVYVLEPTTGEQVRAVVVDSMGVAASAAADVPLNVVVTGPIDAQPHRFRMRSAPGGISVAHFSVTAGTIGCLAIGRTPPRTNRLMILSNNHVLANSNNAVFRDCICQPGPFDGGRCTTDQIGILERFIPINFGVTNFVDCATCWTSSDLVRPEIISVRAGVPNFFRIGNAPVAPVVGMMVGKSGRTTQLTAGRVTEVAATISVNYPGGRRAVFQDQVAVTGTSGPFSAGGDSGSSIWTWDSLRRPVGLLFAGGGATTFANRMDRVVASLDIALYT
jgi:hypothetical protein